MKVYATGHVDIRYCLKHLIHYPDYSQLPLTDSEKEILRVHLADERDIAYSMKVCSRL